MNIVDKNSNILFVSEDGSLFSEFEKVLQNDYTLRYEKNGRSAISYLKENIGITGLVVIDEKVSDLSIDCFMEELYDNRLLDKIPVICLFHEYDEKRIDDMFSIGITDFMTLPFDSEITYHRVCNVLAQNYVSVMDYVDAVNILKSIYYKIYKINLSNDTYSEVIDSFKNCDGKNAKYTHCYSKEISIILDENLIHSEDVVTYREFMSLENIKKSIEVSDTFISNRHRRKINDEYKWVQIEIAKSEEYTKENQVVMLFFRDVNDEYSEYLMEMDRINNDAMAVVFVNVTKDMILSISEKNFNTKEKERLRYSIYLDKMLETVPSEEDKIKLRDSLSISGLKKKNKKGEKSFIIENPYIDRNGKYAYVRTNVRIHQNNMDGDIIASIYSQDISEQYVDEILPTMLYKQEYETVGLIDAEDSTISIRLLMKGINDGTTRRDIVDYDSICKKLAKAVIASDERKKYLRNSSISHIVSELKKSDSYEFTIYHYEKNGEKRLMKYKFSYFSKVANLILSTVEDVTKIAEKDVVTGGYNRQGFVRRVESVLKENEEDEFRILYFDIKGFKAINEIFGAQSGDEVIRHIYDYIAKCELNPVAFARTSTDHFVCLIKREDLNFDVLSRLCQQNYSKRGKVITVYLRCGIYNIDDRSLSINTMSDRAKLASANIKNEYVSPFAFYEHSLNEAYIDKNEVLGDLKRAIDNNEFEPYYQPIYDVVTGKIASAEALVRWRHPIRGMVSPGVFVPALEENGHISKVDLFIEKRVKEFNLKRLKEGKLVVPVSVNLSRMDFYDVEMISTIFEDVENDAELKGLYRFEVTESSYVTVAANNFNTLKKMSELGAKILIDDFGSGYSSFNTITEYAFDIIKLDMEFIRKIGKNSRVEGVIRTVIDLAHYLNAKVIAEGAETEEQVNFLTENECDYIQGYYFSKPLPEEEFIRLLDEQEAAV